MTEQAEGSIKLQEFLNEVTKDELSHFPDVETDGDKIATIWDNLYVCLGKSDENDNAEEVKKNKEKIREINLARIIGIKANRLKSVFEKGMLDEKLKKRLDRTFACTTIFMRIFEDPKERARNLMFPQPALHHKTPIEALMAGNVDRVLYFAAMSGRHHNLV